MVRTKTILLAIALLVSVSFGCTAAPTPGQAVELSSVSCFVSTNPNTVLFLNFIDKVNKELKGELQIKYKGGPEVIAGREQYEAVRTGVIDMLHNTAGNSRGVVPEMGGALVAEMSPKQLRDSGYFDVLDAACRKKINAMYLGHLSGDSRFYLFWNKVIKDPQTEFKGMKLRGTGTYAGGIKALGAESVNIDDPEVFSAMQQGVVEGMGQPLIGFISKPGLEKTVKYGHIMAVGGGTSEVFLNMDAWNKIPKQTQDKLLKMAIAEESIAADYWIKQDAEAMDFLKKSGIQFVDWGTTMNQWFESRFSEAVFQEMEKAIPDVVAKFKAIKAKK